MSISLDYHNVYFNIVFIDATVKSPFLKVPILVI